MNTLCDADRAFVEHLAQLVALKHEFARRTAPVPRSELAADIAEAIWACLTVKMRPVAAPPWPGARR